ERQTGADLEDGEVVAYQRVQRAGGLVVGGMRLEHHAKHISDRLAERTRRVGTVVDDLVVVELDPGLHDRGDDPRPCRLQLRSGEGPAVRLDRGQGRLRGGGFQAFDRL